jgi:hypothetical protein
LFGLKILIFFDADPDPGSFWSRMRNGKIQIRDEHPGSRNTADQQIFGIINVGLFQVGSTPIRDTEDWIMVIWQVKKKLRNFLVHWVKGGKKIGMGTRGEKGRARETVLL